MSTNVTVNGRPLEEVLSEQAGHEIAKVRLADERPIPVRNHIITKHTRNHSNGRTAPGVVLYEASQKAQKVIIRGTIFPYAEKQPFPLSGKSALGALVTNADETEIECHECGEWFGNLGIHLSRACSGISVREYKIKHGLKITTGLMSPTLKKRLGNVAIKIGLGRSRTTFKLGNISHRAARPHPYTAETANLRLDCRAQLETRIISIASKLGRCPTRRELQAERIHGSTIKWAFGVTMRPALKSIGLTMLPIGHVLVRGNRYTAKAKETSWTVFP